VEGLTEELTASLARISGLRVIARTSAARYKDSAKPVRQIARDLRVDALLEGSVAWSGARVRINTRLVHGATEQNLWAESYEREVEDILALQDEVAQAVAGMIRVELTPEDRARLSRTREVDPGAFAAYLRGRYYWNKRTTEGIDRALQHFQEALARDPKYAEAYAGLADCYLMRGAYNMRAPRETMPQAKQAALAALAIDGSAPEPHASLGMLAALYEWDWPAADREFRRAIALNPGYATAHQWYGVYLMAMGRFEQAIAENRIAQDLDPLSLSISENGGWLRYCARQYDQAIEQFQKTLELDPHYGQALRYLGLVYLQKGLTREARDTLERARAALGAETEVEADLALAYALAGEREMAKKKLEELLKSAGHTYVSPFLIASFHTGLGQVELALDWLEKAYQERNGNLVFLNVDPLFDKLRGEPRFRGITERMGLPP
jgi:TolB-like protein/Tfp pilus assembly protein PilF